MRSKSEESIRRRPRFQFFGASSAAKLAAYCTPQAQQSEEHVLEKPFE